MTTMRMQDRRRFDVLVDEAVARGRSYAEAFDEVVKSHPHLYVEAEGTPEQRAQGQKWPAGVEPEPRREVAIDPAAGAAFDAKVEAYQAEHGCTYAAAFDAVKRGNRELYARAEGGVL